jgi:CRISPR/Cas system-associated exonuclease Cas4 (RecB family)
MKISQSFINDAIRNDVCPKRLEYKYVLHVEPDNENEENPMFRGRYFEWHLLGKTRDGIEPVFKPLQRGGKPKAQTDLDELIEYARDLLKKMGLDPAEGDKQLYLESEELSGNIDWRTKDFASPTRKALYDVKYTETKIDDRYIGWADFETKDESKRQATQYILLNYLATGEYLPFYFLVFGKSKWCKIIKVEITSEGVDIHMAGVERVQEMKAEWAAKGWPASPKYEKCRACDYRNFCQHKALIPEVEIYQV